MSIKKLTMALAVCGFAATGAMAQAVQENSEILGQVNIGSTLNFNEIETNAGGSQWFGADQWIFKTGPGGTGAVGEVVPLNITLLGSPAWQSTVTHVELWEYPANFGDLGDRLFSVANPNATSEPFSFTFSPVTPETEYTLFVKYSVGAGSQGGYIGSITAVPEPGALAMAGLGLGVVGFLARRRKRV